MNITYAKYLISSPSFNLCPEPTMAEFAFIGRSNVGKSSLINMLCNNEKLAKTSANPGKTQMINHFEITAASEILKNNNNKWFLVDLPGYGFAKVSISARRKWSQMIEKYLRERPNLTMVFVLIDSRHNPQKIDLEFLEQLKKWNVNFSIIFTKSDKEKQAIVAKNVKDFLKAMTKTWQFLPQHFVTSAVKKSGKDKVLALIEQTIADITTEPTE
jgi:GTP-binding protein